MVRVLSRRAGDICDWLPRIIGLNTNMTIPNLTDKVARRQRHVGICRQAIAKRHDLDSLPRSSLLWGRRTRIFQSQTPPASSVVIGFVVLFHRRRERTVLFG